jgi:hypothetical protein
MKVNLVLSVVLCVSALACADPGDEPAPTAIPKLAANALDPSTLWGSGPALITGILALTNYFSTSITVSLRGDGLPFDGPEGVDYAVQEGAFWGDVFLGASSWGSACNGRDQVLDDTYGDLPMRECAEPDAYGIATPCAFNYAGLCSSACTGNDTYLGYSGCSDGINATTSDVMTAYLYGHL